MDSNNRDVEFEYDKLIIKDAYSISLDKLIAYKNYEITVIGCDSDACVLATCFMLFDNNFNFKVNTEYCYSSGGEDIHKSALRVMKRNFGKCVL